MKREGKVQSVLLFIMLHAGYLWEYHYITIQYFEYIVLAFLFTFLIYYICVSASTKRLRELVLVTLGTIALLSINIYNTNNRPLKDPLLQNIVNNKYEYQFRTITKSEEEHPRLEKITDLYISSKFGVKTLAGIENLTNLTTINISRQYKLIDYSNLSYLNNLKRLYISEPHPDFSISHLPELKKIESLMVYSLRNQFNDEIIELANFPNLQKLELIGDRTKERVTIDIRQVPNIESIDIRMNIEKIIGLEEAENLKIIRLNHGHDDYKDEIKRLRPDIELP